MYQKQMLKTWIVISVMVQNLLVMALEATMTSTWKEGDWSAEVKTIEKVIRDNSTNCICKINRNNYIVCYGRKDCDTFPSGLDFGAEIHTFYIKTTAIKDLKERDFIHIGHVRYMQIHGNSKLENLSPGLFNHLSNLVDLSISSNKKLKELRPDVFEGLVNLYTLTLTKNGFDHLPYVIPSLSPQYLPNLMTLSLSQNIFRWMTELDFLPMEGTNVSELSFSSCQIESITPTAFSTFRRLEKLEIGSNSLSEEMLSDLFHVFAIEDISVRSISLDESGFRKPVNLTNLLIELSFLNVTFLNLARNHIETIYPNLFPIMPSLEILDLREDSILHVTEYALGIDVLPALKTLYLGKNHLRGVLPGIALSHLLELDLSGNNNDDFDIASYNNFKNMKSLKTLNLSFNRISSINNSSFASLTDLQYLSLKNCTIYFIENYSLSALKNLEFLDLERNPQTPFKFLEGNLFNGLIKLDMLLLGYCEIESIRNPDIFAPLINLKYLSIANNRIKKVNPNLFLPLTELIALDFSNNDFEPWRKPVKIFHNNTNLQVLVLSNNKLTYISKVMMNDFARLKRLDLSDNPFICDCSYFKSLRAWLGDHNITLNETVVANSTNVCVSPDKWRNKNIIQFIEDDEDSCDSYTSKVLFYVFMPYFICLLLLSFVCFVVYYQRWRIRYWIFLIRLTIVRKSNRELVEPNKEFKYDAFVSYSKDDRNFVVRLVAMLENYEPFLKLCVYERDFQIGTIITETVLESVATSRKVLLVVSDSFAKSQWCTWEMHLAEHHSTFFDKNDYKHDSFVVVKLGPIASSHMTPTLKYLLKTRIYLEWDPDPEKQKGFWKKLRNTLYSGDQINSKVV